MHRAIPRAPNGYELHGAAMRSHGARLSRDREQAAYRVLLDLRGRLFAAGVRMPEGASLEAGVLAGVEALLKARRP